METFLAALTVCLLLLVQQTTGCSSNSECPGTFDSSDKDYCCTGDGQCCTFNQFFGFGCSSDDHCDYGYTCNVNVCVYTYGLTTEQIIGIAVGAVAFLIFVVIVPICVCCCCCMASQGSTKSRATTTTTTIANPGYAMQPQPAPKTFAQPPQHVYSTGADYAYTNSAFQGQPMPHPAPYIPPVR